MNIYWQSTKSIFVNGVRLISIEHVMVCTLDFFDLSPTACSQRKACHTFHFNNDSNGFKRSRMETQRSNNCIRSKLISYTRGQVHIIIFSMKNKNSLWLLLCNQMKNTLKNGFHQFPKKWKLVKKYTEKGKIG